MDEVGVCVVGAGVVGLAVARQLAEQGESPLLLDSHSRYGEGISSRNSEVIHAGIYYASGSLKARLCVRGKQLLYAYCAARAVPFKQLGKLIVATSAAEEATLEAIQSQALANGVEDLAHVDGAKLSEWEPAIKARAALLSPSTGIVSAHGLMTALLGDLEAAGGLFVSNTTVVKVSPGAGPGNSFIVACQTANGPYQFSCRKLVNSAGLGAQQLAKRIDGLHQASVPPLHLCKGSYFLHTGKSPFNRLIYPVPEKSGAGLGVHATLDLGGQLKFGPDVEFIDQQDYQVSPSRTQAFRSAIRRYYPGLAEDALTPGYAGIRPKLQGPGQPPQDFVIQGQAAHGIPGLVQLFGIESPGLTSSLAIAETVQQLLPAD